MYFHTAQAAKGMAERGTFSFAGNQIPHGELNRIFEEALDGRRPAGARGE